MKRQPRSNHIDTVGGVLIVYMIFIHCIREAGLKEADFVQPITYIFACFMAWFFFKSGMFHKELPSIKEAASRNFKKMARPYVSFIIIGWICYCISFWLDGDTNIIHYTLSPPKQMLLGGGGHLWAAPLWFLVTLFLVKTLSSSLLRATKNRMGGGIACGVIGLILALLSRHFTTLRPYYLTNFFPAMFFYVLGHRMKEKQYDNKIFYCSIIVFVISLIHPSLVDFSTNVITKGSYLLWMLYATAGIVMFNNIFKRINRDIWPFTQIGRESMYWYVAHWALMKAISLVVARACPELQGLKLLFVIFGSLMLLLTALHPLIYKTKAKGVLGL